MGDQIRFIEFKSYKNTTNLSTTASAEQLMSYLSQITSMAELRYVFNDRKTNLSEAKTKMQSLLQGSKKDEIFEVIWRKNDLRESLFGVIDPVLLSSQKPLKRAIYDDWLATLDSKIFIIVDVN